VVLWVLHCFYQFINNRLRCGKVGIAHPQVYDVFTFPARLHLERVYDAENIRGKPGYPSEFLHVILPVLLL
jgi:hypothetical protein